MEKYGSRLPTDILEKYQNSIHGKITARGDRHVAQCITCHGVHDIVAVNNPKSPVYPLNIPNTCNKCHGNAAFMKQYNPALPVDQYQKYLTSLHGKKNKTGDLNVAQCASCHSAHDIRPAADPKSSVYALNLPNTCAHCHSDAKRMAVYKIPTDQFDRFAQSVHGVALLQKHDTGAPATNDCHGNHGSTPPGVESISNVCGVCHAINSEMFSQSPHKKAFDEKKLPECETCHGNHLILSPTDEMLGVQSNATCFRCHSDPKNQGYQVAQKMRSELDSLKLNYQHAMQGVNQAEQKGMEVTDYKFALNDVRQNLIEARTSVHAFQLNAFQKTIKKGFNQAGMAEEGAHQAIAEFYFRRKGLGVSTLIITILVILLYLKVKEIEKKQQNKN
jgi:predicted CXXCH cytochrome family protein